MGNIPSSKECWNIVFSGLIIRSLTALRSLKERPSVYCWSLGIELTLQRPYLECNWNETVIRQEGWEWCVHRDVAVKIQCWENLRKTYEVECRPPPGRIMHCLHHTNELNCQNERKSYNACARRKSCDYWKITSATPHIICIDVIPLWLFCWRPQKERYLQIVCWIAMPSF